MQTIDIKTFESKLEALLAAVANGETLKITEDGKVVARVIPPDDAPRAATESAVLQRLIAEGVVTPAKIGPDAPLPPRHPTISLEELMRDLDESRSDR